MMMNCGRVELLQEEAKDKIKSFLVEISYKNDLAGKIFDTVTKLRKIKEKLMIYMKIRKEQLRLI
jgi:hypothetical protein